ncbi:alpha/beta fold hydrolase [Streptomyces sp. NPDC093568]|uniref:alpha/beta fold hydrolase n=1 Tax=Streptomyces sp. NPDC093568 TaxID=3366041 RepID=UPI00381EBB78
MSACNTTENAADFADLRRALRIHRWNVYGYSYGTDLALTYLRRHPQGIRSVAIDSVVPRRSSACRGRGTAPVRGSTRSSRHARRSRAAGAPIRTSRAC